MFYFFIFYTNFFCSSFQATTRRRNRRQIGLDQVSGAFGKMSSIGSYGRFTGLPEMWRDMPEGSRLCGWRKVLWQRMRLDLHSSCDQNRHAEMTWFKIIKRISALKQFNFSVFFTLESFEKIFNGFFQQFSCNFSQIFSKIVEFFRFQLY